MRNSFAVPAVLCAAAFAAPAAAQTLLYDNGGFITGQNGTGDNISVTQSGTIIGLSCNANLTNGQARIADDFILDRDARLSSMNFYTFQTASDTGFRYAAAYVAIFNESPINGGTLVYGDFTTNRLTGGDFSGVYRVSSSAPNSLTRPISRLEIDLSWLPIIETGRYYIVVSVAGDPASTQNVFAFPVTPRDTTSDNGEQFFGGQWFATQLDFPFQLFGEDVGLSCGTADFDSDGDSGTDADIEAFFRCLAGDCCTTCFGADFDADGDTGTDADIEAFFRVLAGQTC